MCVWCTPVIPASWYAEEGGLEIQSQQDSISTKGEGELGVAQVIAQA
jgi:hypothetical protein